MLRKILWAWAIIGSASASAATYSITPDDFGPDASVITFETGTTQLPRIPGVTFKEDGSMIPGTHFNGTATFIRSPQIDPAFFGQQLFSNTWWSAPGYSNLGIVLPDGTHSVGAWIGTSFGASSQFSKAEQIAVRILDANNQLLASTIVDASKTTAADPFLFVGFASDTEIRTIEWLIVGDTRQLGIFGVDNVTFSPTAVPLPPATALFLSGLSLIAYATRKNSAKKPEA